jgi:hypothetical protein
MSLEIRSHRFSFSGMEYSIVANATEAVRELACRARSDDWKRSLGVDFICFGSRTFSSWTGRAIVRKKIDRRDCANNLKDVFAMPDSPARELSLPGIEKRKTVAIDKKPDCDLRPLENGFELSFDIEGAKNKALLSVETIGARMVARIQLDEEDSKCLFGNKETPNADFAVFGEKCLLESALDNYRNNRKDEPPFVVMEGLFRSLYLIAMEADKTVAEHIAKELREAGRFKGGRPGGRGGIRKISEHVHGIRKNGGNKNETGKASGNKI